MNIKSLITMVTVALVLLLVGLTYVFNKELGAVAEVENAQEERERSLLLANELRQSSDDLTTSARAYVSTGNPKFERDYNQILAIRTGDAPRPEKYQEIYWDFVFASEASDKPRPDTDEQRPLDDLFKEAGFTEEEFNKLLEAENDSNQLVGLEVQAFNLVKGLYPDANGEYTRQGVANPDLARELLFSPEYFAEKAKIMTPLEDFYQLMDSRTSGTITRFKNEEVFWGNVFIALVVLTLIAIALLGYLLYVQNRKQLTETREAQARAEVENEQLNDSVINILEAVGSLAQRDLTVRAPVTEDVIGTVSDSLNLLADETADVLHGVTDIAGQVSSVSDTVREQAAQVSQTAQEERENVQKMFETLFEATQTMNQVAALAEQSNESAEQATEVTEGALQTVNNTVTGMESIRETISETEKRIKRLGERSQEISGIVNLINTISERTHVLALNASMQAAVAGEAGRGFAVVAEEVQQLAESSRNATEQIATLVNNIQIETNETINTVNLTIGQVVDGSEQAQQAGEQMRKTQAITAELVARVQSIAKASQDQKNMSAQLLEAVQEIGDSTEKTAEQIAAQNAGTEELQNAAKMLVESVNVFKLPEKA